MRILTGPEKKKTPVPNKIPRHKVLSSDLKISSHIPVSHFITRNVIGTRDGDMLTTVHLEGFPQETTDVIDLNQMLQERAHLLLSLSSSAVQIYYHFVRREEKFYPDGDFANDFSRSLDREWESRLERKKQFRNDHYVTLLLRPKSEEVGGFLNRKRVLTARARNEALERLGEFTDVLLNGLRAYEPRILSMVATEEGGSSEAMSLFGYLLNGSWRRYAPPRMNIADALAENRLIFGRETISIMGVENRFAAMIGFKEYPSETTASMLNGVFRTPAEFVVTQAFCPVVRDKALAAIELQQRRMAVAQDAAESLRDELSIARDDLASGRLVFGEHHIGITVYATSQSELQASVSAVRGQLTNAGLTVTREDMLMEPAFWAMFPGNLEYARGRAALISSANFATFMSLASTPQGDPKSIWGPAISIFETSAGTPYHFNFHVADVGNTVLFGPTGSGKTALLSFLIAQADRVQPRIIVLDKDRGAEIVVRALGGKYVQVVPGLDARLNPFKIGGNEAEARAFLADWVSSLLYGQDVVQMTPEAIAAVRLAVDEVRDAPVHARQLELLSQTLGGGNAGPDLQDRLSPWIGNGDRAWAFNSRHDEFSALFDHRIVGIDLTKILDDRRAAVPWMNYLFSQIEKSLQEGRPTLIVLDEAWRAISFDGFASRLQDWMKVIRKLNGAVIFATQEPEDAAASQVGRTVLQQSPTQILLPNPRATEAAYIEALRLTPYELELVRAMGSAGRYMMIRRNDRSVLVEFDLRGMKPFIDVLSARASSIQEVDDLRAQHGDDPNKWLPIFMERRK